MPKLNDYKAYLFDVDGTILDTVELILASFDYSLRYFGNTTTGPEDIRHNIGLPLRKQMEMYLGPMSDEFFFEVNKVHMENQLRIFPKYLRLMADAKRVISSLRENGKKLAVVTSRKRDSLDLYLQHTGIFDLFDLIVSPEDTALHKPDPQPVLFALEHLGVSAKDAVMIGDAIFDLQSAWSAEVDAVLVGWSPLCEQRGTFQHPVRCISTFTELL